MLSRRGLTVLGLLCLAVAAVLQAGKLDPRRQERPWEHLQRQGGHNPSAEWTPSAVAVLAFAGAAALAAGMWMRGKPKRAATDKQDGLDRVLFWWSKYDPLTIRSLVPGILIAGKSGSGKTTSSGALLARSILDLTQPRSGGLVLSATPSDRAMWERWFQECGRWDDLRLFGPEQPLRFNALEYVMTTGSPREITNFLTSMSEAVKAGDQKAGENAQFFEREEARMIYHAVVIVRLATSGRMSALDLQNFIATAAQTPAQMQEEQWVNGFHSAMIRKAMEAKKTKIEQHDFDQACEYYLGQLPSWDSRTRANVQTGVFGLFHVICGSVVHELLAQTTNITPDDLFAGKWVLVDMSPAEWGDMGLCVAAAWKTLTQKAILKRRVDSDSNLVVIWADEAHQFYSARSDHPFLAMARARKAALIYLVQSVNSFLAVKGEAGKHEVNALMANWQHIVLHALGDSQTADLAVGLLGKKLTTFIGGSMAPPTSLYDELMGRSTFTGTFNEQYSEVLQSNVFMTGLRTGGPPDFQCDAIVVRGGIPFSTGENYLFCTFSQR